MKPYLEVRDGKIVAIDPATGKVEPLKRTSDNKYFMGGDGNQRQHVLRISF